MDANLRGFVPRPHWRSGIICVVQHDALAFRGFGPGLIEEFSLAVLRID